MTTEWIVNKFSHRSQVFHPLLQQELLQHIQAPNLTSFGKQVPSVSMHVLYPLYEHYSCMHFEPCIYVNNVHMTL